MVVLDKLNNYETIMEVEFSKNGQFITCSSKDVQPLQSCNCRICFSWLNHSSLFFKIAWRAIGSFSHFGGICCNDWLKRSHFSLKWQTILAKDVINLFPESIVHVFKFIKCEPIYFNTDIITIRFKSKNQLESVWIQTVQALEFNFVQLAFPEASLNCHCVITFVSHNW